MSSHQYATSQAGNRTCFLKSDYSFYNNHKCLECKFCYRLTYPIQNPKKRVSSALLSEEQSNLNLAKVPLTVSRYCEPFLNETFTNHSIYAIRYILNRGGQVVIKTSKAKLPKELFTLIETYQEKIMVHFKVTFHNSKSASILKKELCPGYSDWTDIQETIKSINGCQVAILYDPYIIGLNSYSDLKNIIKDMINLNVTKLIVSQLFSTYQFKIHLMNTNTDIGLKLSESVGIFYTYDNVTLLSSLLPIIELCKENNIKFSMCNNKHINHVLKMNKNCCLFDNPDNIYDPNGVLVATKIIPGE